MEAIRRLLCKSNCCSWCAAKIRYVFNLIRYVFNLLFATQTIQVYIAIDIPKDIDAALNQLCKKMSHECIISNDTTSLQPDQPFIVVCPIVSRLEADIDHALTGLDWKSRFIVLVLHQGNEHSLPGLPTASRLPEKSIYKNADFVDIAVSFESKIYNCDMNNNAEHKIKKYLERWQAENQ